MCRTPLVTALSIMRTASVRRPRAASKELPASSAWNFLMAVFTLDFMALFLIALFRAASARLAADLVLAKLFTFLGGCYFLRQHVFYHMTPADATDFAPGSPRLSFSFRGLLRSCSLRRSSRRNPLVSLRRASRHFPSLSRLPAPDSLFSGPPPLSGETAWLNVALL